MKKGNTKIEDRYTGVVVEQLTHSLCNSATLYFTDRYWVDDESVLICSDKDGHRELWRLWVETGESERITSVHAASEINGDLSSGGSRFTFGANGTIYVIAIENPSEHMVEFRAPSGWEFRPQSTFDAGGEFVYAIAAAPEGESVGLQYQKSPEYLDRFRAHPSRIYRLSVTDGSMELLHETDKHLQHVNASPTMEGWVTFAHEGPWPQVPQRVWLLDGSGKAPRPVRPQNGEVAIGHEQWLDDGHTIGYHGRILPSQNQHIWGWYDAESGQHKEYTFLPHSSHAHARNRDLAVLDGTPANLQPWFRRNWMDPYLFLLEAHEESDSDIQIRVLCEHRSSFNASHPHPQLSPDSSGVLFSSDVSGYSQVYYVQIPDLGNLPTEFPSTNWSTAL